MDRPLRSRLSLRSVCAVTGLMGLGPAVAQQAPSAEELLRRIEQIQADSQRQIDALRKQVEEMRAQSQAQAQTQAQAQAQSRSPVAPAIDPKRVVTAADAPGFINVPGSENSFKISGRLFVTAQQDFTGWTNGNSAVPAPAPGNFAPNRIPVPDFSAAYRQSSGVPGGFALQAWGSGIYAELYRRTDYGPLTALVALDAVPPPQVPVNQSTSNNVTARLQRAYLTLGPWLIGQDFPNFTPSFRADTADPGPVPAIDWMLRSPQIRYTHAFDRQTQLRIAIENPDTDVACYSGGAAGRYACGTVPTATVPATVGNTSRGSNGIGFPRLPVLSLKAERLFGNAQGLLSGHAIVHQLQVDDGAGHTAKANATAFGIAGWWQPFGRDRIYGHAFYGNGLGHFSGDWFGYSGIYDGATRLQLPRQATAMLGYRHYWAERLRTSLTYGRSKMGANDILPLFTEGYTRELQFAALNFNWEVAVGVNLFAEYDWGKRTMQTRQSGVGRRLATGLRYFF